MATAYVDFATAHPYEFDIITRHDLLADSGRNLRRATMSVLELWITRFMEENPRASRDEAVATWASIHGVASLSSRRALEVLKIKPNELLDQVIGRLMDSENE